MEPEICAQIWSHCTRLHFTDNDLERWKMLDGLDIQIIPDKMFNRVSKNEQSFRRLGGIQ